MVEAFNTPIKIKIDYDYERAADHDVPTLPNSPFFLFPFFEKCKGGSGLINVHISFTLWRENPKKKTSLTIFIYTWN